jgi:putative FmdB family regulatory protein
VPTYSYKCTECGNAFDIQQAFTDDSLTECPVCGGRLRKVFGSIGVTFNGAGFYRTDSRAGNVPAGGAAGGSNDSSPKSDPGTKSESGAKSDSGSKSESGSKKEATKAAPSTTASKGSTAA